MAEAYATGDYTMQQIADCFDVHYATVSRVVAKVRTKTSSDSQDVLFPH